MMKIDKQLRLKLGISAVVVVFLAFEALALFSFLPYVIPIDDPQIHILNLVVVILAFLAFCATAIILAWELSIQFVQHFFNLSWDQAKKLIARLVGTQRGPLVGPLLRVQDGRANPDAPSVLYKVGGPGYLSVAHNSAAVTSRFGKLYQILGPGFHPLEPFERFWDVVDLRPQRRRLSVEFMTSDGIPACCDAEIRFWVAADPEADLDSDSDKETPNQPYSFSKEAVLKLTTNKYVTKSEGPNRISDWCKGLVDGALDGQIRDLLEEYKLNDFVNPADSEKADNSAKQQADQSPDKPSLLKTLEETIESNVKAIGRKRGIDVDWVRLEPVRPSEKPVFDQWTAFWQARSDRDISKAMLTSEEKRAKDLEKARIEAQVEFLTSMLNEVKILSEGEKAVPSELIVMSFMDVVRTLSEHDPAAQQMLFHQAESLQRIIANMLDGTASPPPPPPGSSVDPKSGEPRPPGENPS